MITSLKLSWRKQINVHVRKNWLTWSKSESWCPEFSVLELESTNPTINKVHDDSIVIRTVTLLQYRVSQNNGMNQYKALEPQNVIVKYVLPIEMCLIFNI